MVVFLKKEKEMKIIIFNPPPPPSTQVRRGSPFSGLDESSWALGLPTKSAKRSQTNLQMNHIKGAAPIVSPLVSAENWLIKGKK